MNQQILSQDEVDALLQGITGESQKLEAEEVPEGAVRDYNLVSQERQAITLICRANYTSMNGLIGYLADECCSDSAGCAIETQEATA